MEALFGAAGQIMGAAAQDPRLFQVITYSTLGVPRVAVDVDKEKVLAQGLRLSDVYDAMTGYFGQYYANDFNRFNRTWQVTVSADAPYRASRADFDRIKVKNGSGEMVPLSAFIEVRETAGPDRVQSYNTYLALDIQGSAAPGRTGDEAKAAMQELLAKTLPPGITYEWTDLTYQQDLAGNTAIYVFPMCVLLVFLVLAAFYESLVLPMAIILIVPLTILAALGGIWLMAFAGFGFPDNNIMTQIGLIVLVGLACKNAILVVEFARDAEIHRGIKPFDAVLEACRLRLRPVLMTSIAFILGVLPLVLSSGAGAELRRATGEVVFFGMIGATSSGLNFPRCSITACAGCSPVRCTMRTTLRNRRRRSMSPNWRSREAGVRTFRSDVFALDARPSYTQSGERLPRSESRAIRCPCQHPPTATLPCSTAVADAAA